MPVREVVGSDVAREANAISNVSWWIVAYEPDTDCVMFQAVADKPATACVTMLYAKAPEEVTVLGYPTHVTWAATHVTGAKRVRLVGTGEGGGGRRTTERIRR